MNFSEFFFRIFFLIISRIFGEIINNKEIIKLVIIITVNNINNFKGNKRVIPKMDIIIINKRVIILSNIRADVAFP